ncbi:hypothetical protein [Planomonospora sp. ID82291]|uniref:hypothetical protein n=1 Tax=Planomonospora sp. ID82291 TaxID=2738136 RepID=UPI0018C40841|nr:hypothetical protein [Planomonospora sp. ID82291]MBG0819116.1 hypothetical protein [Planomonospora sp. ID82291]
MDILTLTATGAGGLGVGVILGALVLRPRVGPWYGSRPACPCHSVATVTTAAAAMPAVPAIAALPHQMARQITTHSDIAPDSLVTAYVTTGSGVVPVMVAAAALMPAAPGAGLVPALPSAPGQTAGSAQ